MLAPLAFLILATLCTAFVAYGVHPVWGQCDWGMGLICMARRLQWPVLTAALVFAMAVIIMVISGKRRAWWLIGLGPIVALLLHRFATGPTSDWHVEERPEFVAATEVASVPDDAYVVGLIFEGQPYAYPYSGLFYTPVVVQAERDKRLMLMWSAYANKATATLIDREIKPRELDIVSTPANALLIYNSRVGEFINGFTGLTPHGDRPTAFRKPVVTEKLPWGIWRKRHPETKFMLPSGGSGPSQPILPVQPMPSRASSRRPQQVLITPTTQPVVVPTEMLSDKPLNVSAGPHRLLLMPASLAGTFRAFDRHVDEDLVPLFAMVMPDEKGPKLIDSDSHTLWSLDGKALVGPLKGQQLQSVQMEQDMDLRVVATWYPNMLLAEPEPAPVIKPPPPERDPLRRQGRKR